LPPLHDLDDDLALEVAPGIEAERRFEAIVARVCPL
jgi:hypothetical protein